MEPLEYLPGQSVSMELPDRPRIWRLYSMANAPRDDLTMDFPVRMLDGGVLSTVLARGLATGARQVTRAVPIRAAECHGEECRLLRHLLLHVDAIEIRRQERVSEYLAVENLGGGGDRRRTA